MGSKLVIVESPAKAKTINKMLGDEYVVLSSMGHVRDLPAKKFGVDVKDDFKPVYVQVEGKKELVNRLKKEAARSEAVYLAPDPDREGEAIAWHLEAMLGKGLKNVEFLRVTYNEITPRAVREAFRNPRRIDLNLVNAQQARRIVDRIVGYKVSPLLWGRVKGAMSAGRVQSVALRLMCELEDRIINFKPEEYWVIGAKVRKLEEPVDPFEIRLVRINGEKASVKTGEQARALLSDLDGRMLVVSKVAYRDISKKPFPPFITSSLQQAMSARFGISPSQTMRIAQKLYEGVDVGGETAGLITYMRTDSFNIAADALDACRGYISAHFKDGPYLPEKPNYYRSRSGAQGAHEAIRPTDVNRTPDSVAPFLAPPELKVYRAVWERFVASQMAPASVRQTIVDISAGPVPEGAASYTFRVGSSHVVFDGFMKVFGVVHDAPPSAKEGEGDPLLKAPPLAEGEKLERLDWLCQRKETKPPDRFTEGSLVRELERNGVGRPSTYAQIIQTLLDRRYVTRQQRTLFPTRLGMDVSKFLAESLSDLFDVGFTSRMEEELDGVETGKTDWVVMMRSFYERFRDWMEKAKGPGADMGVVAAVLNQLEQVKEWGPEVKYGRRIRGDRRFVDSIRDQVAKKTRAVSQRQLDALGRIAWKYEGQVPGMRQALEAAAIQPPTAEESAPPSESTVRKISAFEGVSFAEPVEKKRRVYDDGKVIASFRARVESGRELTPAQLKLLDRIFLKYCDQIRDFAGLQRDLGVNAAVHVADAESGELLALFGGVREWKAPVEKKGRIFSDAEFFKSLAGQFEQRKSLSPRQKMALKRLAVAYMDQIPDFAEAAKKFGIGAKRGRRKEPEEDAVSGSDASAVRSE